MKYSIKTEKRITGKMYDIVIATMKYTDESGNFFTVDVTYNVENGDVIVHNWYEVENLLDRITEDFRKYAEKKYK